MADRALNVEVVTLNGLDATDNAITTGNTYQVPNNGRTLLHFRKTGAGDATITFTTPRTVAGLAVADPTVRVPATTGDVLVGPFPPDVFNDTDGVLEFTTDEGTSLTCACFTF